MKKIIFGIIFILLISGCSQTTERNLPDVEWTDIGEEIVNENMNGKIIEKQGEILSGEQVGEKFTMYDISYEKGGKEYRNYFLEELRPALDWINDNIEEDAKFLNWWDYGHMIRGYTGREVVVYSPSEDMLWSLSSGKWDTNLSGEFSTNEKMKDVALAFLASDFDRTKEIMVKYDTNYFFATKLEDYIIDYWAERLKEYYSTINDIGETRENIFITKMLNEEEIEGFSLVYNDDYVKIYKKN
ncbi:MAG: hypothetical protein ABIB46_00545 [bacterium]